MKINKVIFTNFAAIKNAMGANTITIDFTEGKNKICLIIGRNGSGKTTILSMLHPFADLGNLDVRNGNNYILEDKEGYKEITIEDNGNVFVIKHFYTPHKGKSHSVKSYISKNGVELNTNGNVSSFKEYVREELQIEPEYLKLIRLGANVTNLINLSATERKNFMSKILEEVGVYLEYYKRINNKIKELSSIISHDEDRMNRLDIIDEKIHKEDIKRLEIDKEKIESIHMDINNKIAVHMDAIKDIKDPDTLMDKKRELAKRLRKLESVKERTGDVKELSYYEDKIDELSKENEIYEEKVKISSEFTTKSLDQLDSLMNRKKNCEIRVMKEENTSKELQLMEDNLTNIRLKLRAYEKNIGDFDPKYTKDDVLEFVRILKRIDEILETTYAVGKEPIAKVIELMESAKNVQNYIDKHRITLDEKYSNQDTLFLVEIMNFLNKDDNTIFACKDDCAARRLFTRLRALAENREIDDNVLDANFYNSMEIANNNIRIILKMLYDKKDFIELLPDNIKNSFLAKEMYKNLCKLAPIYNESAINDLISDITEVYNYEKALEDYVREEENLKKFKELKGDSDALKELDDIEGDIISLRDDISKTKEDIIHFKEVISDNDRSLEVYSDIKEMVSEYDSVKELYASINKTCEDYLSHKQALIELSGEATGYSVKKEMLSKEIQDRTSTLAVYKELKKQLKKYHKIYDDMILIKEALSSKEGIPLYFITNYLGNVEETTNELLDIIYKGETYIDNFVITPTEFSIPFFHNGVRLNDVKYASQGELSFLSLALSFALSSQAISHYNIMLWDEIDGVLDATNREKFIEVLENQIDRVDSEQNFLITHNNMFSSYPVDILDLSFENDTESYPLANYIEIKRK